MDQFIARQPILNEKLEVLAYELFYRSRKNQKLVLKDGNKATSKVLNQSIFGGDIGKIVGDKKVYINFTEQIILDEIPLALEKDRLVVEVLENVKASDRVIEALKKIKKLGYTIALDDIVAELPDKTFLQLADIAKVDFMLTTKNDRRSIVRQLKKYKLTLLAEKVETIQEYEEAKSLGFTLFQGYFFAKPNVVKTKEIKAIKANYVQLLNELSSSTPNYVALTKIIESDVALSFRILRLVNSAAFYRRSKVQSIKQALVTLGFKQIKKWISLIMIEDFSDDKPDELIKMSLIRGKMMEEIIINTLKKTSQDEGFLVGLLSLIDVMTEREMSQILDELPLEDTIFEAIVHKSNDLGKLLNLIEHYESSRWQEVESLCKTLRIDIYDLPIIYFDAMSWTDLLLS